jgi:hypothetical protein
VDSYCSPLRRIVRVASFVRGHEVALNPFINGVSFWENPHTVFSPGIGVDYIQSMNVMTGAFPPSTATASEAFSTS